MCGMWDVGGDLPKRGSGSGKASQLIKLSPLHSSRSRSFRPANNQDDDSGCVSWNHWNGGDGQDVRRAIEPRRVQDVSARFPTLGRPLQPSRA